MRSSFFSTAILWVVFGVVTVVGVGAGQTPAPGQPTDVLWGWTWVGADFGLDGAALEDLDGNGKLEIVGVVNTDGNSFSTEASHWVSLEWDGERYEPVAISEPVPRANVLVVGQADNDPELEVFLGTDTHLHVYEARERLPFLSLAVTGVYAIASGDIDADGEIEVVVTSGGDLEVYDIATGTLEQNFPSSGGGLSLAVGQADSDPALEIAAGYSFSGSVIDGVTGAAEPGTPFLRDARLVMWTDVDADGVDEVLYAEYEVLTAWSLQDDSQVWQVTFTSTGGGAGYVYGLKLGQADSDPQQELIVSLRDKVEYLELDGQSVASPTAPFLGGSQSPAFAGDVDGDGRLEAVRGIENLLTGGQILNVQDLETGDSEFHSMRVTESPVFDAGDIDGDGVGDLLVGAREFNSRGQMLLYDGASRKLMRQEPSGVQPSDWPSIRDVGILQLDADSQKEVCFSGNDSSFSSGLFVCYDSVSGSEDFRYVSTGAFDRILQADADGDGVRELLLSSRANSSPVIHAVDPQSGFLKWRSPPLIPPSQYQTLFLESTDLDGDQVAEVLVGMTNGRFTILDGSTGLVKAGPVDLEAASVLPLDLGADGLPELILGTGSGKVIVVDPVSLVATDLATLGTESIDSLEVVRLKNEDFVAVATDDELRYYSDLTQPAAFSLPLGVDPSLGDSMVTALQGNSDRLWVSTSTGVFEVGAPGNLFLDGFESGDSTRWSQVSP